MNTAARYLGHDKLRLKMAVGVALTSCNTYLKHDGPRAIRNPDKATPMTYKEYLFSPNEEEQVIDSSSMRRSQCKQFNMRMP